MKTLGLFLEPERFAMFELVEWASSPNREGITSDPMVKKSNGTQRPVIYGSRRTISSSHLH